MQPVTAPVDAQPQTAYMDDDLVYVDPYAKKVVGKVTFDAAGKPKKLRLPDHASQADDEEEQAQESPGTSKKAKRPRVARVRYCPWGTYRSMKRVYKLEGKPMRTESNKTLDEAIERALREPFWD